MTKRYKLDILNTDKREGGFKMTTDELKEFYYENGIDLWNDNLYFEQVVSSGGWYYDNERGLWFNYEN